MVMSCFLEELPCSLALLTECKRNWLLLLLLPWRLRLSLLLKESTLCGSEDPSWLPCLPSNRCGSQERNTMSLDLELCTESASKLFNELINRYLIWSLPSWLSFCQRFRCYVSLLTYLFERQFSLNCNVRIQPWDLFVSFMLDLLIFIVLVSLIVYSILSFGIHNAKDEADVMELSDEDKQNMEKAIRIKEQTMRSIISKQSKGRFHTILLVIMH